jgi:hypothetical protein
MKRWTDGHPTAPRDAVRLLAAHEADPPPGSAERGWQRMNESLDRPRSRWPALGWSVAVAAALLLLLRFSVPSPSLRPVADEWSTALRPAPASDWMTLEVRERAGRVQVQDARVEVGKWVELPARITASEDAHVVLTSRSGDRLRLTGPGRVRVAGRTDVRHRAGRLVVRARSAPVPMVIRAGAWRLQATNARVRIDRLEGGHVRVEVELGEATLEGPGAQLRLLAGRVFDSRSALEPPAETAAVPTPRPAAGPRRPPPAPKPTPLEPPVPVPSPALPVDAEDERDERDERARRQRALLQAGKSASNPEQALAHLDDAALLGPPLDEVAAYRAIRVLRAAGEVDQVEHRLTSFLQRWPAGELTEVVHQDLVRHRLETGRSVAAHHALKDYLQLFPAAGGRPEVAFLRAECARARADWAAAADAYELAARAARFRARSTFLRGLCLARAGDSAAAKAVLRGFLHDHPDRHEAAAARAMLGGSENFEAGAGQPPFTEQGGNIP